MRFAGICFLIAAGFLVATSSATAQDPAECTFWVVTTTNYYVGGNCSTKPKESGFEEQHWQWNCTSQCGGGSMNNPLQLRLNGSCKASCNFHCQWRWEGVHYTEFNFSASGTDGRHAGTCAAGCEPGAPRAVQTSCYPGSCGHACWEPLILSLRDDRYRLTDSAGGVPFDLTADGEPEQIPWTAPGTDEAFIVLDRNRNGVIDDGRELFSHVSPQPPAEPGELHHGFRALAIFDEPINGGNADGVISAADRIFAHLQLWHDGDHDGETDLGELSTLASAGLSEISLDYTDADQYFDRFGNDFHFSADAMFVGGRSVPAWAVFFAAPTGDDGKTRKYASVESRCRTPRAVTGAVRSSIGPGIATDDRP